jgi:hypothetical protein
MYASPSVGGSPEPLGVSDIGSVRWPSILPYGPRKEQNEEKTGRCSRSIRHMTDRREMLGILNTTYTGRVLA